MPYRAFQDRAGERYGRLLIIRYAGVKNHSRAWLCKCDCGKEKIVLWKQISQNHTRSCGCLWEETKSTYGGLAGKNIKPSGESAFNQLFYSYKKSARERGYSWGLSKNDFREITAQPCYYCGAEPTIKFHATTGTNGHYYGNGVDRIDNGMGYTVDNVRPCCKQCNIAKGILSEQDFYSWVIRVASHSARFEHGESG